MKTTDTFLERLRQHIGKEVVVESIGAIPVQDAAGGLVMVFSPLKGKLIFVFADGFTLHPDGSPVARDFRIEAVRSVMLVPVAGGIITAGPIVSA